jgi:5-methylcytosine-specific restriction endonuclease McrBC GTP-binding regulatory subunit McrB
MHYLYQYGRDSRLKGRICLVLLDEMNLARVEYYFSDFLSKLEDRRNLVERPYIDLEVGSLDLSTAEKRVYIPDEFLFIGTMNEDETTQVLSDKVLDRANVLTFGRPNQLELLNQQKVQSVSSQGYLAWNDFRQWVKEPSDNSLLSQEVRKYLDEANDIMELLGRPFAHRVFQAFTKYVCNYPNADRDEVIRNQAIADQFGQKLLPKLRGVMVEEKNVKEELKKIERLISQLGDEALNQAFEKAREGQYGQFQWKGMVYR